MSQHPEIIATCSTVWLAPVGTAFPDITAEPGEDWTLVGSAGTRNYAQAGVTILHDRNWVSSTPAAETGESVVSIEGESLRVQMELIDLTLEQYSIVLGGNVVTSSPAGPAEPGIATIGLALRSGPARQFAVLLRGPSPYDEGLPSQYEFPRACEAGSPRITYRRGQPSGLAVEFRVLTDLAATSEEHRFGRLVAQVAPAEGFEDVPSGLEVGSESLKYATGNLQVANQTSVLKQSTTGLTNILTSGGTFLVVRFYVDFDRMNQNSIYCLLGNEPGTVQPGNIRIAFLPRALNNIFATRRQKFEVSVRRNGGATPAYTLASANMPEVSGWYDLWVRRTGDVTKIDVYNMAGTKVSDGTASALTEANFGLNNFLETHFYIGDAVNVASEATTSTARGVDFNSLPVGWEGAVAFVGWGSATVSDADCEAIALGAAHTTRISASSFTYARRLRDTGTTSRSPVSGTSDTSAACTVIGTFLPGGTPGRQTTSDWITLDPVQDYRGFGVNPDTLDATVLFEGSCGGVAFSGTITEGLLGTFAHRREVRYFAGVIQGRFITEAGVPVSAWQQVATTTATGITDGRTFTENSRSAPAIKVLISGQSQMDSFAKGTSLNNTMATPSVSLVRREVGSLEPTAVMLQTQAEVGNNRAADGVAQMAKVIQAAAPGGAAAVTVVFNAVDGTGISNLIDDWVRGNLNTLDLLDYSGNDITIDLYNWHSTDAGQGSNFGANVLGAAYLGTGSLATANQLPDIRSASAKIVIAVATRETTTSAGPFDTDQSTGIGLVRQSARSWAAANGAFIAPEQIDMKLAASNGPHQDQASTRGNPRIFGRMGEGINRALGFSTSVDPSLGTPRFVAGKASFTLTATLPNAGSSLRVDNTATYGSNVQGFEISTDGGTTWSRSGFTATFSGTTVTLTKSSGNWTGVTVGNMRVRYAWGGPFSYGTSLEASEEFRGLLYDGTALESNLGLPLQPLASTVVAEP
jgi:hypothetical protein